jgi:hypothetical protein
LFGTARRATHEMPVASAQCQSLWK